MTDLRQAAQWALQYLESNADADSDWEIITALRTALEQQAEPVMWNAGVVPMWPQQKEGEIFSVAYTITTPPQQQAELKERNT